MGLIYNPSESGELVSNFQANLTSCEQVISDLKKGNNHLVGVLNSKQLGGAAFDAGLAMFSQLVIPTVNKVDISIQDIKTKLQQFSQYTAAAGGEILDEDKLNQQLEELRRQQATLTSQIRVYQNQARINDDPDMVAMCYSYASDLSNFMNTVQDDIRKVEEKLKKLHELDMKTSSLFSESQNEIQNLSTAILAVNSVSFDSSGKLVIKGSGKNLKRIKEFIKDIHDATKNEALTTIFEETIQEGVKKKANDAAKIAAENAWKNRYATGLGNGKIVGRVPGATAKAMKDAEGLALKSGANLGKCVTAGVAVVGGVMDGFSDYQQDKNVGKAVTHGMLSTGAGIAIGIFVPGIGWGIAAGVVASMAIDWVFDQKPVKEFFKDPGKTVGKAIKGASNFFNSLGKVFA
ncbi:T7SS effector LXG polymorphic toxin [Pseudolactococcus reticulitermitis]|uniref:LXG domain-containing protein n=1 Tax=Pseudolactococcus reticulitermitis TaxID=2025039 RepID=A0A224XFT0_9LACT|nr:T7SS effector LXG polymorphic toxin [Lactococcus reticulitermitis]GAX48475.1 hypothetical protein RsY01_2104 [Lactococcus reticulitermitis]